MGSLKTKFSVLTFINPFFHEWIQFNYYSDLVTILKKIEIVFLFVKIHLLSSYI